MFIHVVKFIFVNYLWVNNYTTIFQEKAAHSLVYTLSSFFKKEEPREASLKSSTSRRETDAHP